MRQIKEFHSTRCISKSNKKIIIYKDRSEKNYASLLRPVMRKCRSPLNLNVIVSTKSDSGKQLRSHEKMRRIYQNLDFYLVTSSFEGTPNPALEAASCGVPLLTTRVGNMTELVQDEENGYFIKCRVKNILRKLKKLKEITPKEHARMSKAIRESIVKDWSWRDRAKDFEKFFSI